MLHHQDGPAFVGQATDEAQGLLGAGGVQVGQGLVQEQDGGPHGQGAGDGHLLLLAP